MINLDVKMEAEGFFQIRKFGPDGEMRGDRTIKNLITNNGMNLVGTQADWMTACYIGASQQAASVNDTSLIDRIALESTTRPDLDTISIEGATTATPFIEVSRTFTFDSPASGDVTVREIGVGLAPNNLFSRTVLPLPEVVRSDETLIVKYIHRWYTTSGNISSSSIDISGTTHEAAIRVGNFAQGLGNNGPRLPRKFEINYENILVSNGGFTPITTIPSQGLATGATSANIVPYVAGEHSIRVIMTWGSTAGITPSGGIRTVVVPTFGVFTYQIQFTPSIPKTAENSLSITFQVSWARR